MKMQKFAVFIKAKHLEYILASSTSKKP